MVAMLVEMEMDVGGDGEEGGAGGGGVDVLLLLLLLLFLFWIPPRVGRWLIVVFVSYCCNTCCIHSPPASARLLHLGGKVPAFEGRCPSPGPS